MTEIPELRRSAREATATITSAHERSEAAEELYEHLLSSYEESRSRGLEHDAAVKEAEAGFGTARSLSADLSRAHRQPITTGSGLLLVIAAVAFFGVLWTWLVGLFTLGSYTGLLLGGGIALAIVAGVLIVMLERKRK